MNSTMIELKNKLKEILPFIKDKNDVIYLDYPMHHNVGDLLIYQGALKLLKDNGVTIKIYRSADDYNIDEIKSKLTLIQLSCAMVVETLGTFIVPTKLKRKCC